MRGLSFRAKVFVLFAGATLLIVVPALLLIARTVERNVYEKATDELAKADSALQNAWADRELQLMAFARAKSFDAVDAWRAGSRRALERALRKEMDKELWIAAVDTTYRPLVLVGPEIGAATLEAAARAPGTLVALPDTGRPVRLAVSPVYGDTLRLGDSAQVFRDTVRLGTVGVGDRLSAAGIRRNLTIDAVALIVGDSLVDTTLPDSLRDELRAAGPFGQPAVKRVYLGRDAYQARTYALPTQGLPARVVLFRRTTEELRVAEGIAQALFGIGFAALLLALLLAALVARIVARPAQALAEASARLARGDYRAPLPRDSGDEIGQLARAFGEMRKAIAEREARLRSAQAEMIHREKLAAMGRLVAQLSHEINNPIYNIQNCLEALERRGNPTDPNREFLTLAQEELARLAKLTRQLLDQSRPLSDAAQPVSLNTLVHRVLTLAGPELEARGIRYQTELAADLPLVVAHPEGVQQVLANLVNNASDAMPGGGTLRVLTRAEGDAVEVVVEDTGTGIAEADLPHIFEAFYTTKPGVTGLGLGLFVSEGIIRGHRGRLSVESTVGKGSRFTIRLPRETLDGALAGAEPVAAVAAA